MFRFIIGIFAMLFLFLGSFFAKVEVNTDINKYNDFIGPNATEMYQSKWGMNEEIFPEKITNKMNVSDFKMVYYNPWDAQYLSYLVVNYNEEDYLEEVNRLENISSTDYKGYYGVTGFSKYHLLAMQADSYNGFVYAITDGKEKIIYVELIFCNYFYDLNYSEYINNDYLPDGFDATSGNPYKRKMMGDI